jgi:hypothetical protein
VPAAVGAIVSRAPAVLGHAPLGFNESTLFHAVQGLVDAGVVERELAAGLFFEPGDDFDAVHGSPAMRRMKNSGHSYVG